MPRFEDTGLNARVSDAPRVTDKKKIERSVDPGALDLMEKASGLETTTAFERVVAQSPVCKFGYEGICCRICLHGPCRIKKDEGPASKGVCGASAYTIVARNIVRLIAGGASAHSDHGLHITKVLEEIAAGKETDYKITDPAKLKAVAKRINIETEGKTDQEITREVVHEALEDYKRVTGEGLSTWLSTTITEGRNQKFQECGIFPAGINETIMKLLHQTHIGVDADPVNIIFGGLKTALSDFTGMHIATDLSDILFGTPKPVYSEANLGVLDPEYVNVVVHGHNPVLSEMIVSAAREMKSQAEAVGAKGVKISGICCTGNEVLMRQGVPIATNFAAQELAIMTGVIEAMVVDVQCIMPSIQQAAECFHTKIITTVPEAKIPGAYHYDFKEDKAMEIAQEIIGVAIEGYKSRVPDQIQIPEIKHKVVAGFSLESMVEIFSKINPEHPIRVLNDAILEGEIKGVALFCGCNNLKRDHDENHLTIAKELLKENVFIVATGCSAQALAKQGLLDPDKVEEFAGEGLAKFISKLNEASPYEEGLPAVYHMGSCVDNTRAADLLTMMANDLGVDTPKVPYVATAPEAMSEKAVSIGSWNVAMGLPVHVGSIPPIEGSELVDSIATQIAHDVYGGHFLWEVEPMEASKKLLAALDYRSWKLRIHKKAQEDYETQEMAQGY